MATLIVMDHSGDTRHYFDMRDKKALRDAEFRFKALQARALRLPFGMRRVTHLSSDHSTPMQRKLFSFRGWSAADGP
jgi:hypothetical protein